MLRSIPGMKVFRPADHVEVAAAWSFALRRRTGPVAIALTRQSVPSFERQEGAGVETVLRGGYVVREAGPRPDAILVATGSEVATALTVARALEARGAGLRVVSMPCLELFHEQTAAYRDTVLLPGVRVATLEAGATFGWHRVCGTGGLALGLDRFGASAPASVLEREFGFTPDAVASCVGAWLGVK
jgi:transketolase